MLWLSDDDVAGLLDLEQLASEMESAFRMLASGRAICPRPLRIDDPTQDAHFVAFPALVPESGVYAAKIASGIPSNAAAGRPMVQGIVAIIDSRTGETLALMGAGRLTAARTAAASAVAIRALSRRISGTLAIVGTGSIGRAHAEILPQLLPVDRVIVSSGLGRPERAEALAHELAGVLPVPVEVGHDPASAIRAADIIVTASVSGVPLFAADAVAGASMLVVTGPFLPGRTEVPVTLIDRAARVVSDLPERLAAQWHSDPAPFRMGGIESLAQAVAAGRKPAEGLTVFLSDGLGLEDLVAARIVYEKALERGVGTLLR